MRLLAIVLAVPTLVLAWQWWSDRSVERRLEPVVSAIAGRDVQVDCQTLWGALVDTQPRHGEVVFDRNGIPEARIFLTHETCDRLGAFAGEPRHDELACLAAVNWAAEGALAFGSPCYEESSDTVYALLTLAHESYHTAGVLDEADTNCLATQAMGYAATALGAPPDEALLAARAMAALLPLQFGAYRTVDCVPGSRLDIHPSTAAFPTELPIVPPFGRGGRPGLATGA
jgi:hypothetical protein